MRARPTFLQVLIRSEPVRVAQLALGLTLMTLAPVAGTIPAPLPIGLVLFGLGLALVLKNSSWARRKYVRWKHRYPRAGRITEYGLRRRTKRKVPLGLPVAQVEAAEVPTEAISERASGGQA